MPVASSVVHSFGLQCRLPDSMDCTYLLVEEQPIALIQPESFASMHSLNLTGSTSESMLSSISCDGTALDRQVSKVSHHWLFPCLVFD